LTVIFFDEALDRAKELDKVFETTGKTMGPYHSLPFSIKDHFNIKGKITSAGYIAFADAVSEEDASLVAILREAGAVFYCKTTNSQTLIHLETNSNIYGRTLNPYNRGLTSGGSSGGEGALVAFHGSPIGLGSDGGGSIRGPAANCGLIGFKQTSGRVPISGTTLMMNGSMACPCVFGPICRSARDSEYFMKVVIATEPWRTEPDMVPIPWRPVELPKTLTIGVFSDDGVVRPHPPITTAIEKISKLLGAQKDIKIVPWKPFDHFRGYDIIRRLYFQDGGQENYGLMAESGEPILPLSSWVFKPSHTSHKTIEENWYWNCEREKYRSKCLHLPAEFPG
jgi:amidase